MGLRIIKHSNIMTKNHVAKKKRFSAIQPRISFMNSIKVLFNHPNTALHETSEGFAFEKAVLQKSQVDELVNAVVTLCIFLQHIR